jgi:pimeloyl-ACP methyl ester carboxylesterase
VTDLTVLAHSMGGLVARSACHYGSLAGHAWVKRLDRLVFLGAPHFGAPLERAGTGVDRVLEISPYSAPFARIGKVRSAGIRDLGHGYLRDEDWQMASRAARASRTVTPLPSGVKCCAMAASRQPRPPVAEGVRVRGDGLVPIDSALGRHRDGSRDLGFADECRRIGYDMGHLQLLDAAEAYETIRGWLSDGRNPDRQRQMREEGANCA